MTRRENILLKVLITVLVCASFYVSLNYFNDSINENTENERKYIKLTEKVNLAKIQAEEEKAVLEIINESEKVEEIQMAELLERILSDMKSCNIRPERYQINTKGKNEYVDFSVKCTAGQFTNYLSRIKDASYPYTISNVTIKTEEEGLSASIRYELIPEKVTGSSLEKTKAAVQKMLRSPYKPPKQENAPKKEEKKQTVKEEKPKEVIIDGSRLYKVIGFIKDSDNVNNLYVKTQSGRMIKISPENIVEEDSEKYIVRIDNNKVKLNK